MDGSCSSNEKICASGLLRDSTRSWILGFAHNIGWGIIQEVELWGTFEGSCMAWMGGHNRIVDECDSLYDPDTLFFYSPFI